MDLQLSESEWDRVGLFCDLLSVRHFDSKYDSILTLLSQHADKAQQAFSSDQGPSLHNTVPAIEALYSAWDKRSGKLKYKAFAPALEAATSKLDEYYTKTAASDAHILTMGTFILLLFLRSSISTYPTLLVVLHPSRKMEHFKKYWSDDLCKDVIALVEDKESP